MSLSLKPDTIAELEDVRLSSAKKAEVICDVQIVAHTSQTIAGSMICGFILFYCLEVVTVRQRT